MCGILFAYDPELDKEVLYERASRSIERLGHRGPDDVNITCIDGGVIGHTRLSIIDLEQSRQPFQDHSGRFIMSYNGEIYNYKKLRIDLEPFWNFKTNGDTEVLFAGMIVFGCSFLEKLEGMWSFILWDNLEKKVLLCRDRVGKKPLYYYRNKKSIYCGSELPALKSFIDKRLTEDLRSTNDYLRYGIFMPGRTIYNEVQELKPATIMQYNVVNRDINLSTFWELDKSKTTDGFKISKQKCTELIKESTKLRMVSDVDVGSFLSGGIDSTIVTYLGKQLNPNLKTFSVSFEDKSFDESLISIKTSKIFKTEHFVEKCSITDASNIIDLITNHIGQPFGDASILPTSILCQFAAEKVKVVLTGDGGDELFSGYKRYQAIKLLKIYKKLPDYLRKYFEASLNVIPASTKHHSSSIIKQLQLFMNIVEENSRNNSYISPVICGDGDIEELLPNTEGGYSGEYILGKTGIENELEMMYQDLQIYLPQDILLKVDRASMAYSLECRSPYLDSKLIEYLYTLPIEYHRDWWNGKKLLKESFKEVIPKYVLNRPKQGFSLPISNWFKGNMGDKLLEYNRMVDANLNKKFIERMVGLHRQSKKDYSFILWNIYTYYIWKSNEAF